MLRFNKTYALVFWLSAATAIAQPPSSYESGLPSSHVHTSASYPQRSPNAPQHHASTYQEGVLRGRAAIMQAYYNGQMSHAQARILLAEAVAREMQLPVVKTKAAQEKRQLIAAEWQQYRQQKLNSAELGQKLSSQRTPLRYAAYRLSDDELNRLTGEIRWPLALTHQQFDRETFELDRLFGEFIASPSQRSYLLTSIESCCERLQAQLRDLRDQTNLDSEQYANYLACYRYVLGLKYEAATLAGFDGSMYTMASQ